MKTLKELGKNSSIAFAFIKAEVPSLDFSPIVESIKDLDTPSIIFVPSKSIAWYEKMFEGVSFVGTEIDSTITLAEELSTKYLNVTVVDLPHKATLYEDFGFIGVQYDASGKTEAYIKSKNYGKFSSLFEGVIAEADVRKIWSTYHPPIKYTNFIAETTGAREKFFSGDTFAIGDSVTENNQTFEVIDKGSNYFVVVDSDGNTHRKFPKSLTESTVSVNFADSSYFKGYTPSSAFFSNTEIKEALDESIRQYNNGLISDPFALLKSIKMIDSIINEQQVDIAQLKFSLSKIGHSNETSCLVEMIDNSLATQLQAARIIAGAVGAATNNGSPTELVNNAIRVAKKSSNVNQLNILKKMLLTASKVGLKYDKTLLESVDDRIVAIHKHQTLLKEKPTDKVLKDHQDMRKLGVPYAAKDVGGKRAMIRDILDHNHGPRSVSSYKALKAHVRRSLGEDTTGQKKVNEVHEDPDYDTERDVFGYNSLKKHLAKITGIQNYGDQEPGKSVDLVDKNGVVVRDHHHTRPGFSLNSTSETNRKMKVKRLRDE
jgi:hypothetical protein